MDSITCTESCKNGSFQEFIVFRFPFFFRAKTRPDEASRPAVGRKAKQGQRERIVPVCLRRSPRRSPLSIGGHGKPLGKGVPRTHETWQSADQITSSSRTCTAKFTLALSHESRICTLSVFYFSLSTSIRVKCCALRGVMFLEAIPYLTIVHVHVLTVCTAVAVWT